MCYVQIMFFQCFFFTCGGAILFANGLIIHTSWESDEQGTLHKEEYYWVIEFAGAGVSILLYVS